ncbi:MAG: DUF885 domain-containing protein [Myxococcales bacterium]|nr:DUF885 domain-containing protein [Myxococcales bacterium]MCB9751083.1 DUF885 domain-containing protein [Myxococcales bacterium]
MLDGYFALAPVAATGAGAHEHDGRWPDVSPEGVSRERAFIEQITREVAAIPRAQLDADAALELELIQNHVDGWRFALDVERWHHTNPFHYVSSVGSGLDDLISRDFAPLEQRADDLASRLEGLPKLIDQALANLRPAEQVFAPHARVAAAQLDGAITLIEREIPERTKAAPPELRRRIADASPPAAQALRRMQTTLRDVIMPVAKGQWRLGPERFDARLRLTLQTNMSAEEVVTRARAEHDRVRARMATLARELYPSLLGEGALENFLAHARGDEDALNTQIVRDVLAALADDHPTAARLRDACEANLERLQRFVADKRLVPLDPNEVLEVIWTPPHARGYAIAGLASPGPLDAQKPGLPSFYLVQPVPEDWSEQRRESFLREYNSFMLEILSIHEAIPGHFVQLYLGKREPSRLRRVLGNGAFIEGWAVYAERLMVEAGYAGAGPPEGAKRPRGVSKGLWRVKTDPALRARAIELHGLKFYLRTVTNAILDNEIHAGDMTEEQAVRLMVERSYQEEGEARAKWVRAQLISTQLSTYFVGATAWFALRERAEAQAKAAGAALDLHGFHGEALGHGAPPVHRLPALMGWADGS